jgi:hypothetical protein
MSKYVCPECGSEGPFQDVRSVRSRSMFERFDEDGTPVKFSGKVTYSGDCRLSEDEYYCYTCKNAFEEPEEKDA